MNEVKIFADEFTGKKNIDWVSVCDRRPPRFGGLGDFADAIVMGAMDDNFSKIAISPICKNERNFLKIRFQEKYFKPKKGDTISFLFDKNKIEVFSIDIDPYEIAKHSDWGLIKEVLLPIMYNQLIVFSAENFITWKFKSSNKELLFKSGIAGKQIDNDPFRPLENLQNAIKNLFNEYLTIAKSEIPNLFEDESNLKFEDENCFVYLMKDHINGAYKIGISNSPEYREKTLQSEKPSIELIESKQFQKRKIAETFERLLHEYFKNKRIRGEWFQLDNADIIDFKLILNR